MDVRALPHPYSGRAEMEANKDKISEGPSTFTLQALEQRWALKGDTGGRLGNLQKSPGKAPLAPEPHSMPPPMQDRPHSRKLPSP